MGTTFSPQMTRAISRTMLSLEMALAPDGWCGETRYLPFVSLDVGEFAKCMEIVGPATRDRTFLDVGCGIGTKLALASCLGFEVSGIEIRADYAEVARRLVPEARIAVANALEVDAFTADVVYAHRCCLYDDEQRVLERRIAAGMDRGALLVLPHGSQEHHGEHLGGNVWRPRP